MPLRVLQHGFAGTTESVGLEPGAWKDVERHGQFLIDLEFLLRYGPRSGTASCMYCKSPPYLNEIASQFPWIHFYVFEHQTKGSVEDYDPAQPELVCSTPLTVQVEYNKTMSSLEFTKDMARTMGERGGRDSLLMICHGQDSVRQLALHVLMRPTYSLLDVCGVIPVDYLEGELVLPVHIPNNKIFTCLVAHQSARCKAYDPAVYLGEIGKTHAPSPHPLAQTDSESGFTTRGQASSRGWCAPPRPTTRPARTSSRGSTRGARTRSTAAPPRS